MLTNRLVFIDSEFTDFVHPQGLSIGLVADDGKELYVEVDLETRVGAELRKRASTSSSTRFSLSSTGVPPTSPHPAKSETAWQTGSLGSVVRNFTSSTTTARTLSCSSAGCECLLAGTSLDACWFPVTSATSADRPMQKRLVRLPGGTRLSRRVLSGTSRAPKRSSPA